MLRFSLFLCQVSDFSQLGFKTATVNIHGFICLDKVIIFCVCYEAHLKLIFRPVEMSFTTVLNLENLVEPKSFCFHLFRKMSLQGLERRLMIKRTGIWFLAPTSGSSQLSVTLT